jgi:hypothetical protein
VDYLVKDNQCSVSFQPSYKEALRSATVDLPYRGPEYYQSGEYIYKTKVVGAIEWFQGYEEIFCQDIKVYECYYHGGLLKK